MEGPLVYQADVTTRNITKTYQGLAGSTFKQRYYGHKRNLIHRDSCGTALSKYIWYLKDRNVNYTLEWSIKNKAHVYSAGAKYCDLCLSEKTIIMLGDKNCLNILHGNSKSQKESFTVLAYDITVCTLYIATIYDMQMNRSLVACLLEIPLASCLVPLACKAGPPEHIPHPFNTLL